MREPIREFVAAAAEAFCLRGPIYEFGSYLVSGQEVRANLRGLFPGQAYVGCDLRSGPGVDRIEDLARLSLADGVARTVLCLETLEHAFEVTAAVQEMMRVLAPGGVLILSTPFGFKIHNYPDDYWRLTPACYERLLAPLGATVIGSVGVETNPHTVLAVAMKSPVDPAFGPGVNRLLTRYSAALERCEQNEAFLARCRQRLACWVGTKGARRQAAERHATRFAIRLPAMPREAALRSAGCAGLAPSDDRGTRRAG